MLNFSYTNDPYFRERCLNLAAIYNKISERNVLTTKSNEQLAIEGIKDYQTYHHKYVSLVSGWVQNNPTIFIDAVKANARQVMLDMLDLRIDVNTRCPKGSTGLMWAVESGNMDLVKILIEKGADVNASYQLDSGEQITPLFFAVNQDSNPHDFIGCLFNAGARLPTSTDTFTGNIIKKKLDNYIEKELSNDSGIADKIALLTNQIKVLCQLFNYSDSNLENSEQIESIQIWSDLNAETKHQYYPEFKKEYEQVRNLYKPPSSEADMDMDIDDEPHGGIISVSGESEQERRYRLYKRTYSMTK